MSACLIMAGSGDLELLKRIRKSHGKPSHEMNYGKEMSLHQALGFLFLSSGKYSLGLID